jgi:hypothetical protein
VSTSRYTARRRALKAAGLCGRCGKRQPVTGRATCRYCCSQVKARYVALVRSGKCVLCRTRKALVGRRWCEACREGQLGYLRVYWAEHRSPRRAA